jgi:peptidoglycan/xylan/chitin deacetylase (PgdA/CDA1 family)
LSFDDGPSEATPELLDLLDQFQARATFFLCGANVRRLPEAAREIARRGHEIGNHSDTHARFWLRSPAFVRREVTLAQQTIDGVTGVRPVLFRPPFGVRWFGLRGIQRELGLTSVMWTTIAQDWRLPADAIVRRLLDRARNGAIFCLHDGREANPQPNVRPMIEALRTVLPELTRRGFRFETVSQVLGPEEA